VKFLAPIRDIELMMSRASLVVQASRLEGFPNVVLEAMGMGAAVIAADCNAGPAEIITDGVNGCLVPVDDVHTLADEMGRLMSQPEIREQLGQNAMSVRSVYHQDRIMAQWEECFLAAENLESNNAS
jgi:glycosyltransferase involved in cell wall biosynthesis